MIAALQNGTQNNVCRQYNLARKNITSQIDRFHFFNVLHPQGGSASASGGRARVTPAGIGEPDPASVGAESEGKKKV